MMVTLVFFYKLTIVIDDTSISFKLGMGLFGRKYNIDSLKNCRPVRNSIVNGIGVRMLPNGWLYNVSGLKAIELSFKNKKSIVRIGTDKSEEIANIVTKLIQNENPDLVDEPNLPKLKKRMFVYITTLALALAIPIGLIIYGNQPLKTIVKDDSIVIKGMYGMTINYKEISKIDTITILPSIEFKSNGYAFGKICKGNFRLKGIGQSKLFVYCGAPPYIQLRLTTNRMAFINFKESHKTIRLYEDLRGAIKNRDL